MENNTAATAKKELASKRFPASLMIPARTLAAYFRPGHARGEYAVRMYLPAGESLPNEVHYAYEGSDINAARNAWRAVVAEWNAMYARDAA